MITESQKKLFESYRHVFLYAKGHYKRSANQLEDLRKIIADWSGVPTEFLSENDVLQHLLIIVSELITPQAFVKFISEISPDSLYNRMSGDAYSFEESVVRQCLSIMRYTHMKEKGCDTLLFDIGVPSKDILPFADILERELSDVQP